MPVYRRRSSAYAGRAVISTLLAFILTLWASTGLAQDAPGCPELPNLHKVNEHLYRGGQPRKGGIKKLVEMGIRTCQSAWRRRGDTRRRADRKLGLTY